MKSIIKGKRYDTETADKIAAYWNGLSGSDFRHVYEDLYRTHNGNWFFSYAGGPLSKYAEPYGNNGSCGSKGIRPLEPDEVVQWLEAHDESEVLEKYFPTEIEDA